MPLNNRNNESEKIKECRERWFGRYNSHPNIFGVYYGSGEIGKCKKYADDQESNACREEVYAQYHRCVKR